MELLSTFPRKTSVFQFSRIDFAPGAKMSEKYKFSHIQYLERINRRGAMPKHLQFEISWIFSLVIEKLSMTTVPAGSPSRGGDVTVYVCDINQLSLPTPFYSVLVSFSFFMTLSTVFHSINYPNNSLFSHSVLLVLSLAYWFFQLYVSLGKSPSALI